VVRTLTWLQNNEYAWRDQVPESVASAEVSL
jgi:hypothetical protein